MEWTTLLGLFLGFVAMCGVLMFGKTEASFATFIDPPALLMVFGGAVAVVLLGFPARQIRNLAAIFREPFLAAKDKPAELIDELVQLAEVARKDGLLALEAITPDIRNPFIALGVQLAVGGNRPDTVREIMQNEVAKLAARRRQARKVVELVGRCGPAFGMIATLLGLILMLGSLSKPDTVGPAMAIALTGTLYGALLANLICIPLGEKLGYLGEEEQISRHIVVHGVLAIQAGDNPRVVRQRLAMYLSPPLQVDSYTHAVESLAMNNRAIGWHAPASAYALGGRGSAKDVLSEGQRPAAYGTAAPPQGPAPDARAA
jgi:chemotaxis protein MotA